MWGADDSAIVAMYAEFVFMFSTLIDVSWIEV